MKNYFIAVQQTAFDAEHEATLLRKGNAQIGAVVSFIGYMRDINEGDDVHAMTLEHYPGMTEKALEHIVEEAFQRWALEGVRLIHRVGTLHPCDPIVLVMVASRHRGEAFRACEFIIDYLKTRAPFWKKEHTKKGERWVRARHSDQQAQARWNQC